MGVAETVFGIMYASVAYLVVNVILGVCFLDALDRDEILVCAFFFPIVLIVHLVKAVMRTFKDW